MNWARMEWVCPVIFTVYKDQLPLVYLLVPKRYLSWGKVSQIRMLISSLQSKWCPTTTAPSQFTGEWYMRASSPYRWPFGGYNNHSKIKHSQKVRQLSRDYTEHLNNYEICLIYKLPLPQFGNFWQSKQKLVAQFCNNAQHCRDSGSTRWSLEWSEGIRIMAE